MDVGVETSVSGSSFRLMYGLSASGFFENKCLNIWKFVWKFENLLFDFFKNWWWQICTYLGNGKSETDHENWRKFIFFFQFSEIDKNALFLCRGTYTVRLVNAKYTWRSLVHIIFVTYIGPGQSAQWLTCFIVILVFNKYM